MNRSLPLFGLGVIFACVGLGLFAVTMRKPKAGPAARNKSELREQAARIEERRKLRIAAGIAAAFGAVLILIS